MLCSCASTSGKPPMHTVSHLDVSRYMGGWHVISNIPYFAEKGCVGSVESYALRKDGEIDNWFTYHKKSFDAPLKRIDAHAWVYDKSTNAEWRVRFFGLFTTKYLVLELDPNYQWVLVGHPSRKGGWIMARTSTMPEAEYQSILKKTKAHGYDPAQFMKVPQRPSQVGAPGFQ